VIDDDYRDRSRLMIKRLDAIALGLLRGRPRTGYDIWKWLDEQGRSIGYTPATSQIYRQLARMVDRGWATTVHDPRTSGPDAKLYMISDAGLAVFDEWVDSPYIPVDRPMDPEFQVRVLLTLHRGPRALLELFRTELKFRRAQHEQPIPYDPYLLADRATASERAWDREMYLIMNQRGRLVASTFLTWLETTEQRLAILADAAERNALPAAEAMLPTFGPDPSTRS
jgi:DNA-binding PadR family transcriptional regulator